MSPTCEFTFETLRPVMLRSDDVSVSDTQVVYSYESEIDLSLKHDELELVGQSDSVSQEERYSESLSRVLPLG